MIVLNTISGSFSVDLMAINYFTQSYWLFELENKLDLSKKLFYTDDISTNYRVSTFNLNISTNEDLYNGIINIKNGSYIYTIYNTNTKDLSIDKSYLPFVKGILKYEYNDASINEVYK
jgi:hypothetical protein